ncbi:MAG: hypothetical protein K2O03_09780 [Lachnospiraceae bacterium]|nr:hypothetical protein [Lachnospiraceae bacterium]
MLSTEQEQQEFFREYNISEAQFRNSRLTWEELEDIATDFEQKRNEHQDTVKQYVEVIEGCPYVHSLSYRVKETKHLLEKIIRKNPAYLEKGDSLSKQNYEERITDLMGIRILLLFKSDWVYVHDYLMEKYKDVIAETPFAHIRKGDDDSLYRGKVRIKDHKPYRSVHYVIRTKGKLTVEIQVRTLYEEAWSEIDHKLRYPYNLQNEMLRNYIDIMNRLTGIGDEMGTFINSYIRNFQENLHSGIADDNEVYQFILKKIENCGDEDIKQAIAAKIKQAENYHETRKMMDLVKQIPEYK